MRALAVLTALAAVLAGPGPAQAGTTYRVALVPISSLGSDARSRDVKRLTAAIAGEISRLRSFKLMPQSQVTKALTSAKRSDLASCDGRLMCLAQLGKIAGVDYTVFGELGGLGDAQVIYLKLVAVKARRVIRSTTLEFEGRQPQPADVRSAVVRLLMPSRYTGRVDLRVDVSGASVFVDGTRVTSPANKPIPLQVGSHALRVTHPEFRDFVRFVEIKYGKTQVIAANLQKFPVVASQIRRNPSETRETPVGPVLVREETPWYREWYTVAGIGVGAFVASAVVFAIVADGVDADARRRIDVPQF